MSDPIKACMRALNAYRTACRTAYKSGAIPAATYEHYEALRLAYRALPESELRNWSGFADFLACNDAISLSELRADMR